MILYTVKLVPCQGRSHSATDKENVLRVKDKWEREGFETVMEERPYTPVRQDYGYWKSIYPDGNFPAGI